MDWQVFVIWECQLIKDPIAAVERVIDALTPDDVFRVTRAGGLMPQKSTFFYPKIPTGLVFRLHGERK